MKKLFQRALAAALVLALVFGAAYASEDAVGEDDLEGILLEEDEQLDFDDDEISDALDASLARVNQMKHILLVGIDARPGQKTGRSDTMIIVTVDTDSGKIKLMSLMRDLYVQIPGRSNNRLNAAYIFGGPELLMQTIEQNFGISIDYYVAVNFSMLASLIDQLGGITLTVESDYYKDRINAVIREDNKVLGISVNDGLLSKSGEQLMTGKQAQAYARYRYGTKDGDFGRTARQREVVMKILRRLTELSMVELAALAMANFDNVFTNLTLQDVALLAPAMLSMRDADVEELRIPLNNAYKSQTVSGMSVLVPNRTKTKEAIADFLSED